MTYWILIKKDVDQGAYVPTYEIHASKPSEGKVIALETGEYVDAFKCRLSPDGTYVNVNQFRISNINDMIEEKLTESYILNRED